MQDGSWCVLLLEAPGEIPAPTETLPTPRASTEKPPALKQSHSCSSSHTQGTLLEVTNPPGSDTNPPGSDTRRVAGVRHGAGGLHTHPTTGAGSSRL